MAKRQFIFGGSNVSSALIQNQKLKFPSSDHLDSVFAAGSASSFLGSQSMFSFGPVDGDEYLDEYFNQPEKKRRLTVDQVQFLEKSFEADNKLEPERKVQLAKELSLQPRQIAIWFQNRRARWKTKQIEVDYDTLQAGYNSLKEDYENLLKENDKLKAEVLHLRDKLLVRDEEKGSAQSCGNKDLPEAPPRDTHSAGEATNIAIMVFKHEDLSSAKSDVTDIDSPVYADGLQSSLVESGDSSYVLEPYISDSSQNGRDNWNKELLPSPYTFLSIENTCHSDPSASSSHLGFPIEDHDFGFWSY